MSKLTPFGKSIRKLRVDKNLTLMMMAEKMELSAAFLSAVETGRKPIPNGFVVKVSRALALTAEEINMLRRAVDQTRKEVHVGDKKEDDRELIAAFARRLDEVPQSTLEQLKKLLLKSLSEDVPFQRRRQGFFVPPASTQVIRGLADRVRSAFVDDNQIRFPIIEVLEWRIAMVVDSEFVFDIRDQEELGADEGRVPVGGNQLILREDVYMRACKGNGRDRFTACHELGHYLMHRKIAMARTRADTDKIYCDSEWQADVFAGALLMSPRHLRLFRNSEEMAECCGASHQAADVMWKKYADEGLLPS